MTEDGNAAIAAQDLWDCLRKYVEYCDLVEQHHIKVIGKQYRTLDDEKKVYKDLAGNYLQPVIATCTWLGFKLEDLHAIIPPAFETNFKQRAEILQDLRIWSQKEFGEHVIPF